MDSSARRARGLSGWILRTGVVLAVVATSFLAPRPARAKGLSQLGAVLIATGGGLVIGTIWYDTRQSAWSSWWETASYTAGFLGGITLVLWEDPPEDLEFRTPATPKNAEPQPQKPSATPQGGTTSLAPSWRFALLRRGPANNPSSYLATVSWAF